MVRERGIFRYWGQSSRAAWPERARGFASTNGPVFGRSRSLAYRARSGVMAWPQGTMELPCTNQPLGQAYGSAFRWTAHDETNQNCWLGDNIRCNIPGNKARVEYLLSRFWHWGLVRNIWSGQGTTLPKSILILLHLFATLFLLGPWPHVLAHV